MKKLIVLFVLLFLITGCGYDPYKMPKDVYINLNENSFNIYDKHYSGELISDSNVEILNNEDVLISNNIGSYTHTIEYKYKKRKYKYDVNYEVTDKTPPVIIRRNSYPTVKVGSEDNLCSNISYGDNYDSNPTCTISGEYNLNQVGTYNLEYVITDSYNNEFRKEFELSVVSYIPSPTPAKPEYIYMDELMKYKNDDTILGIDVSRWQGNVDFNKVKNAGIEFVIMRIGVIDEGEYYVDSKFETYFEQAKNAGLKVGVYVYTKAATDEEAVRCANWVLEKLNGRKLDLPIAYDWEDWANYNSYGVSLHTFSNAYLTFEKIIEDHGYESMLYSSKYYLENVWLYFENSNIWLAHYIDQTDYEGKYMLWQLTSSAKISGITDNTVDIDVLYKNNYSFE